MADKDYKKELAHFKKIRQHNAKEVAKQNKLNAKSVLRCRTLIQMFGDGITEYVKIQFMQDHQYREWYERADIIIALQADLKKAVAAKDKGEVKNLMAEIKATNDIATAISKKITLYAEKTEILNKVHHVNAKALASLV